MGTNFDGELTEEFWSHASNSKLVRPVCQNCGKNFFSPRVLCPNCLSADWKYQKSGGSGQIYSFTIVHRSPEESLTTPFVVVDVELDEGWRMFSHLVDCDPNDAEIGKRVKVVFRQRQEIVLPMFTLDGNQS